MTKCADILLSVILGTSGHNVPLNINFSNVTSCEAGATHQQFLSNAEKDIPTKNEVDALLRDSKPALNTSNLDSILEMIKNIRRNKDHPQPPRLPEKITYQDPYVNNRNFNRGGNRHK